MKHLQRGNHRAPARQTVTEILKINNGRKTIQIRTTDQRLRGHAGQSTFWAFFHRLQVRKVLQEALPHECSSPNALPVVEIALGFIAGILAGADKLARIAWLRGDPLLPE